MSHDQFDHQWLAALLGAASCEGGQQESWARGLETFSGGSREGGTSDSRFFHRKHETHCKTSDRRCNRQTQTRGPRQVGRNSHFRKFPRLNAQLRATQRLISMPNAIGIDRASPKPQNSSQESAVIVKERNTRQLTKGYYMQCPTDGQLTVSDTVSA